jgi:DNA-binding NarL/FixJ family response regulator
MLRDMDARIRVLLADDSTSFRDGVRALLSQIDDMTLVGVAADADEAVGLTENLQPDVVLIDLEMPVRGGVEATRAIMASNPRIAVLVLPMHENDRKVLAALSAGARGYVLKGAQKERLLRAIRTVAEGGTVLGTAVASRLSEFAAAADEGEAVSGPVADLSGREREVLELIAGGYANEQIAQMLALSRGTVRNYASGVFAKLQVIDRGIVRAREAGIGGP